eukprot:m.199798 g.199798  ORF g.199798 m.199798 type:complete len:526 (+) comp21903_c3_seq4:129-1706(+)
MELSCEKLPQCEEEEDYFDVFDEVTCCCQPKSQPAASSSAFANLKWSSILPKFGSEHEKARLDALEKAKCLKEAVSKSKALKKRFFVVIFNPVSGSGKAKKVVQHMVEPLLTLAGVNYETLPTDHRGHATEFVAAMDTKKFTDVLVCGGDGMVSEVVTGLLSRASDRAELGLGIVPVGTANAMATHLDHHHSKNSTQLIGMAVLGAIRGEKRRVDVLEVTAQDGTVRHGLSCFGWALSGAIALQADNMRWMPGQKSARYDIASLITFIKNWPVVCRALLEYPVTKTDSNGKETEEWVLRDIATSNLLCTNVPKLGKDHPITSDIAIDDGKVCLTLLPETCTRTGLARMASGMKKGKNLAGFGQVSSFLCSEFKLTPHEGSKGSTIPFNLDGDPIPAGPVHVRVLRQRVGVFALPDNCSERGSSSLSPSEGKGKGKSKKKGSKNGDDSSSSAATESAHNSHIRSPSPSYMLSPSGSVLSLNEDFEGQETQLPDMPLSQDPDDNDDDDEVGMPKPGGPDPTALLPGI